MILNYFLLIGVPITLLLPAWKIYEIKSRYRRFREGRFSVKSYKLNSMRSADGFNLHIIINIYLLAFIFLVTYRVGEAFNLGVLYYIILYALPLASAVMLFLHVFYLDKLKKEFDPLPDKNSLMKFRILETLKVLWPIPVLVLCMLYVVFVDGK